MNTDQITEARERLRAVFGPGPSALTLWEAATDLLAALDAPQTHPAAKPGDGLLPCPFCGGPARRDYGHNAEIIAAQCLTCGVDWLDTKTWNTRATAPPCAPQREGGDGERIDCAQCKNRMTEEHPGLYICWACDAKAGQEIAALRAAQQLTDALRALVRKWRKSADELRLNFAGRRREADAIERQADELEAALAEMPGVGDSADKARIDWLGKNWRGVHLGGPHMSGKDWGTRIDGPVVYFPTLRAAIDAAMKEGKGV